MYYIQRHTPGNLETVDETPRRAEAHEWAGEYRDADRTATYYISNRPCRDWSAP